MQKILFPFHKLSEYDILYKLKVLDIKALYDEKLSNIIDSSDGNATFYLRKKKTDKIKNELSVPLITNITKDNIDLLELELRVDNIYNMLIHSNKNPSPFVSINYYIY